MSVLFVCLGNICRSPTAEAVFRQKMPGVDCDSAGTANWHVGKPPYDEMQRAARARGIGMSDLRARQFTVADFGRFDLILAMDPENLADIETLRPQDDTTPVNLLAPYGESGLDTVPDPWFTRDFETALDILEASVTGLIEQIRG